MILTFTYNLRLYALGIFLVSCALLQAQQDPSAQANAPSAELYDFRATATSDGVALQWITISEHLCAYFTIERSTDGFLFAPIETVPGAVNSISLREYSFFDRTPLPGVSYYRLRTTDTKGLHFFFPFAEVEYTLASELLLAYPSPAAGVLSVQFVAEKDALAFWRICDVTGREIADGHSHLRKGFNQLPVCDLAPQRAGWYVLEFNAFERSWYMRIFHQ